MSELFYGVKGAAPGDTDSKPFQRYNNNGFLGGKIFTDGHIHVYVFSGVDFWQGKIFVDQS